MNPNQLADEADRLAQRASELAAHAHALIMGTGVVVSEVEPFIYLLAIFLMACFVGYYVVWNVTPALHSPLMSVTNAISSVIVVGAMLATGLGTSGWAMGFGFIAVMLASVNIFGGFVVTQRMLSMFKKAAIEVRADVRQPDRARLSDRRRPVHPGAARAVEPGHVAPGQSLRHDRHGGGGDRHAGPSRHGRARLWADIPRHHHRRRASARLSRCASR